MKNVLTQLADAVRGGVKAAVNRVADDIADDAWQEGYSTAMDEADEVVEDKDAFIAKQSGTIQDLMKVLDEHELWGKIPDELRNDLADYV